jgi:hypothetical protein
VVALLVLIVTRGARFGGRRHMHGGPPGPPGGRPWGRPDPLAMASMRYARGEIGRDEYLQLTTDIAAATAVERPPPPPPPPPA